MVRPPPPLYLYIVKIENFTPDLMPFLSSILYHVWPVPTYVSLSVCMSVCLFSYFTQVPVGCLLQQSLNARHSPALSCTCITSSLSYPARWKQEVEISCLWSGSGPSGPALLPWNNHFHTSRVCLKPQKLKIPSVPPIFPLYSCTSTTVLLNSTSMSNVWDYRRSYATWFFSSYFNLLIGTCTVQT